MEQLENQSEPTVIEGEIQVENQQKKYFKTLSAVLDYCKSFSIQEAHYKKVYFHVGMGAHEIAYELNYISENKE